MLAVADANVLFSFFKKDSATRAILTFPGLSCSSPAFAISELAKYKETIIQKAKISESGFGLSLSALEDLVDFIPLKEFRDFVPEAAKISPDPADVQYIALSLMLECPLWSNDKKLKNQTEVTVLSTSELLKLL